MKRIFKPGLLEGLALALVTVAGGVQAAYGYQGGHYDSRYRDDGYRDAYSRVVRCESRNGRTNYCRMETRGGVSLVAQTSQSACIRGRTWGVSQDSVWVSRGCRGRFATARYGDSRYGDDRDRYDNRYDNRYDHRYDDRSGYGSGHVIRCESRDGRYTFCSSYGDGGRVQLRRQLSDSSCRLNVSWGTRYDGVWVDRGCRAEFMIY